MEINNIGALPAHPLIVHLPVVLVPLATVGAILMLIRPSWRERFEIPTAVLAVVAAIATQLAIGSGEALEERVEESKLVKAHAGIAEQARPWVFLFAIVMVAVVVWDFVQKRRQAADEATPDSVPESVPKTASVRSRAATVAVALTAVGLILGIGSSVQIYRTGHSGAKATWHDTPQERQGGDHDGGDRDGG